MSKVVVLKGGRSFEREVSLRSGGNVEAALRRLGHDVSSLDVDKAMVKQLKAERPDVAFIAMHGNGGEDGTVQELLEILRIPYTGSGVSASERAWDKVVSKAMLEAAGVPTPQSYAFGKEAFLELGAADLLTDIESQLGLPLVVKPARGGSALGIKLVHEPSEIATALVGALAYDKRLLLERYVPGRELSVAIVGSDSPVALPIVEAIPLGREFYDFESRYTPGATDLRSPADLPPEVTEAVVQVALETYAVLDCHGFGRVDIMLDGNDEPWVLELNTIPGLTDTSIVPVAAAAAGMSFDDLIARVLELADLGS
ncbi:MAG TPA: D-alanine--D-alanine ligase [Miltoncostaeales bacterium]|nr:D-alanine--D-alanine ligase [Miltoncostaeales bacterium]